MKELPHSLMQSILSVCPEGVTICERTPEGWAATYVNPAFERLTGYRSHELLGRDLRLLQAEDREQDNRQRIRQATRARSQIAECIAVNIAFHAPRDDFLIGVIELRMSQERRDQQWSFHHQAAHNDSSAQVICWRASAS